MRLNAQLYLFGLVQLLLLAGVLTGVVLLMDPPNERRERAHVKEALKAISTTDSLKALQATLDRLERERMLVRVRHADEVVASSAPEELRCDDHRVPSSPRHGPPPHAREAQHRAPPREGPPPRRPPPLPVLHPAFFTGGSAPAHCFHFQVELTLDGALAVHDVELHPIPPSTPPWGALLLGVALLSLLVASVLFGRWLAQPLRRLANAAAEIGEGNLRARVEIDRKDEIGDMARSFNNMARQVELLLRSEKELLASVSHELRTPLTRLRLGIDLAAAHPTPESVAELEVDVLELGRLVEHLLFAAQLEAGQRDSDVLPMVQPTPRLVTELVRDSVDAFARQSPTREVVVEVDAAAKDVAVLADASLIQKALVNLLDNGHKYTLESDALLVVRVEADATEINISVEDRGIGFDSLDEASLFRPFVRGQRVQQKGIKGVGLGLSLVQHIARAHGGEVRLENRSEGGAVVRLVLPAIAANAR